MTLDDLRECELSLMRTAFENACAIAGLSVDRGGPAEDREYAKIAATVQSLVECGISDVNAIARRAAASIVS